MNRTFLIITQPAEAQLVQRALQPPEEGERILLGDEHGELSAEEHIERVQPDVLVLGAGRLGIDLASAIAQARRGRPQGTVILLCDNAFADRAAQLRPDIVLVRPLSDEVVQEFVGRRGLATLPPGEELLRADDVLPDPLASLLSDSRTSGPAPRPTRRGEGQAQRRTSGMIELPLPAPLSGPRSGPPAASLAPEPQKVAVDLAQLGPPGKRSPTPTGSPRPTTGAWTDTDADVPDLTMEIETLPGEGGAGPAEAEVAAEEPVAEPAELLPEGSLEAVNVATLVGRLVSGGYSGCLLLTEDGGQRSLYLEGGAVVALLSTLPADQLPEWLHHSGALSREQLRRAREILGKEEAPPRGGGALLHGAYRQGTRLLQGRLLQPDELDPLLKQHAMDLFFRCLQWGKGRYRLLNRLPPPEERLRMPPGPKLLLEGVRRVYDLPALTALLGADTVVLRYRTSAQPLRPADLTLPELQALELFDGVRSLAAVREGSGMGEHAAYALAYTLRCLRVLSLVRRSAASAQAQAEQLQALEARIRQKRAQVAVGDYFGILEVAPEATAEVVQRAYWTLRAELGSAAVPEALRLRLSQELAEIAQALDEAHSLLSNDRLRAAYRRNLLPTG